MFKTFPFNRLAPLLPVLMWLSCTSHTLAEHGGIGASGTRKYVRSLVGMYFGVSGLPDKTNMSLRLKASCVVCA